AEPIMEIDFPPGEKIKNASTVPFYVKFPTALNNGDVFSVTNNGTKVIRVEIDGDLGVTEFRSRMKLLGLSKIEFSLTRDGNTKTTIRDWKPDYVYWESFKLGENKIGKIKTRARGNKIQVMVINPMGFISYLENLEIKTTLGGVKIELTPLISSSVFVSLETTHNVNDEDPVVNAQLSRAPFLAGRQFLIDTKSLYWKKRIKAVQDRRNNNKELVASYTFAIESIAEMIRSLDEENKSGKNLSEVNKESVANQTKSKIGNNPPLDSERRVRFTPEGDHRIKSKSREDAFYALLTKLNRDGNKRLECVYGPSRSDGTGYITQYFWHKEVPLSEHEFSILPDYPSWRNLGRKALDKCPSNGDEANLLRQENWNAWKQ
ncbi:hypothetical protein N8198_08075, partial [Gammaproteobacteria bacterium]|nr:hypothetical protein [Gammaproteobacteria bacterium]